MTNNLKANSKKNSSTSLVVSNIKEVAKVKEEVKDIKIAEVKEEVVDNSVALSKIEELNLEIAKIKKENNIKDVRTVRTVMMKENGKRVHPMNIYSKDKLFAKVLFDKSEILDAKSENVLDCKLNAKYKRVIDEVKHAITNTNIVANNNNEVLNIRSNTKYFVINLKEQLYLVKSIDGFVKGYLRVINNN